MNQESLVFQIFSGFWSRRLLQCSIKWIHVKNYKLGVPPRFAPDTPDPKHRPAHWFPFFQETDQKTALV